MIDTKVAAAKAIDGATVEVVRNYLISIAEEMRSTLIRTAFNPVIYEVLDFGISIYDRNQRLIAEAPGLTFFLGANDFSLRKGIEYVGLGNLFPGDVVLLNYPYWNAAHTYDATLFSPIFEPSEEDPNSDGDLVGFVCVRAHWMDLGAKDPGYVLDSTDMHQEGLVFPGTKVFSRGAEVRDIHEIIRFNSRMPDLVLGDLHAQVASLRTGERRFLEVLEKFGRGTVDAVITRIIDHSAKTTETALMALPQGTWTAVDWLDDDGITDDPIRMQVTVTIKDGKFTVDFAGSASATRGPVNMPLGSTIATCRVAFKSIISPLEASNYGDFLALEVKAEPGTLFHAIYPAPTFTLWTGIVALELIFKALAQGMPDRFAASSGGDVPGFMMVGNHPVTHDFFAISNNDPVGWGANSLHDGINATIHMSESIVRNTPIEVLEARSGMFFERFEIAMDSAGAGKFRGGCGSIREIRFISPGEFLSVIKKTKTKPWALNGGLEPNPSQVITYPGTDKEQYVSTKRISVEINDRVIIKTAGGGGHGDPKKRDPERIKSDVLEGYVSAEKAMEIYGVNLGDGEMK